MNYPWPGNVRELENAIERAMVIGREPEIQAGDFPLQITSPAAPEEGGQALEDVERGHILRVLEACDWNQTRAAKTLGIDRVTLYNKIKKYGFRKANAAVP
jgi:DNA-binding NtrC family response regulator